MRQDPRHINDEAAVPNRRRVDIVDLGGEAEGEAGGEAGSEAWGEGRHEGVRHSLSLSGQMAAKHRAGKGRAAAGLRARGRYGVGCLILADTLHDVVHTARHHAPHPVRAADRRTRFRGAAVGAVWAEAGSAGVPPRGRSPVRPTIRIPKVRELGWGAGVGVRGCGGMSAGRGAG